MSRLYLVLLPVIFAAALTVISGCATTAPTKFYILNTTESAEAAFEAVEGGAPAPQAPALALGPLTLSDYLMRPHIVTRGEGNEIRFAEFDRWAEPLTKNIYRVLAENLSTLLETDRIYAYPSERARVTEYRIAIEIIRFEVNSNGDGEVVSRWTVYGSAGGDTGGGGGGDSELIKERSSFTEPSVGSGLHGSVTALNKTLGLLSREIASAIRGLEERKETP